MKQLITRRSLLASTAPAALSGGAIALLAGHEVFAAKMPKDSEPSASDVAILGVALALEHEAIAAYQIGAESGLLQPAVLDVAAAFQSHH
jgi:hypothetical protein